MGLITLRPISNVSVELSPYSAFEETNYQIVGKANIDDSSYIYLTGALPTKHDFYEFDSSSIIGDIEYIELYARMMGRFWMTSTFRVDNAAKLQLGTTISGLGDWNLKSSGQQAVNPITGLAWTIEDISSLAFGFGISTGEIGGEFRCSQYYMVVKDGSSSNRYWVGNSGNWDDTSHWSETSGGVGGASVPTVDDNVIIDENSFTETGHVITVS